MEEGEKINLLDVVDGLIDGSVSEIERRDDSSAFVYAIKDIEMWKRRASNGVPQWAAVEIKTEGSAREQAKNMDAEVFWIIGRCEWSGDLGERLVDDSELDRLLAAANSGSEAHKSESSRGFRYEYSGEFRAGEKRFEDERTQEQKYGIVGRFYFVKILLKSVQVIKLVPDIEQRTIVAASGKTMSFKSSDSLKKWSDCLVKRRNSEKTAAMKKTGAARSNYVKRKINRMFDYVAKFPAVAEAARRRIDEFSKMG